MPFGSALTRLSPTCRKQLGLFTRADARGVGVGNATIRRLIQSGLVTRVYPSVFRLSSSSPTWHQQVLAACLDGGPTCLASHRTAAALHGFTGFSAGGVIEVLVPMTKRHRRSAVIVHHTRAFPAEDGTRVGPIPVTSVARTLNDLGAVVPADAVEEALDGEEQRSPRVRGQVDRRYNALRARGRNGIGAMTQIQERRTALRRVPRSVLERRMRRILDDAGLPPAISLYKLELPEGSIVELDFAIVEYRVDVEVDGHAHHSTRRQRAADNDRANRIADAGWSIRRFTYEQVMYEPHRVAASLRSAVAAARKRI